MLLSLLIIAFVDFRPIVRERSWRDAAAFLVLLAGTLLFAVPQIRGFQVPSLMLSIDRVLKSIGLSY